MQHPTSPILYAVRINPQSLLLVCKTHYTPKGKEKIEIDGIEAAKPYLAARLHSGKVPMLGFVVHVPHGTILTALEYVTLTLGETVQQFHLQGSIDEECVHLEKMLAQLHANDKAKLLYLLMQFSNAQPSLMLEQQFYSLCHAIRRSLVNAQLTSQQCLWLLPNLLYMQLTLPEGTTWQKAQLVLCTATSVRFQEVMPIYAIGEQRIIGVLIYIPHANGTIRPEEHISVWLRDQVIALPPAPASIPTQQESKLTHFVQHLQQQEGSKALTMRNSLNKALLHCATKHPAEKQALYEIVKTLQLYLPSIHSSLADASKPFGINVELAAFLPQGGILLAGWIYDPTALFHHLSVQDDCGNSYETLTPTHYFPRKDLSSLYAESPYGGQAQGFLLHIPHAPMAGILPSSVRITAKLHSGLSYTISTPTKPWNARTTRNEIVRFCGDYMVQQPAYIQEIAPLLVPLQAQVAEEVTATLPRIFTIGKAPTHPLYSLVIPLYKRLEFVQAQLASFATDPAFAKAEIIYVLDSPEQYEQFYPRLQQFAKLYHLPITLIVMPENSGYAIASNTGAKHAKGEWLVMMNSDILPLHAGWLPRMSDFLVQNPKVGMIAPQLRYEDNSLQHAGMYFTYDAFKQHYENKHYYKGFPTTYPPANRSRPVPAVTAACVMIRRKLFKQMNMFSTQYVIGDYEDSDLCLKLHKAGYQSYYTSEVQMLHFERQSMKEQEGSAKARYLLNATLHHQQWHEHISEVMKIYAHT